MVNVSIEQAKSIARESLERLNKCGALNILPELSDDEYQSYVEELEQLICDAVGLELNGQVFGLDRE